MEPLQPSSSPAVFGAGEVLGQLRCHARLTAPQTGAKGQSQLAASAQGACLALRRWGGGAVSPEAAGGSRFLAQPPGRNPYLLWQRLPHSCCWSPQGPLPWSWRDMGRGEVRPVSTGRAEAGGRGVRGTARPRAAMPTQPSCAQAEPGEAQTPLPSLFLGPGGRDRGAQTPTSQGSRPCQEGKLLPRPAPGWLGAKLPCWPCAVGSGPSPSLPLTSPSWAAPHRAPEGTSAPWLQGPSWCGRRAQLGLPHQAARSVAPTATSDILGVTAVPWCPATAVWGSARRVYSTARLHPGPGEAGANSAPSLRCHDAARELPASPQ